MPATDELTEELPSQAGEIVAGTLRDDLRDLIAHLPHLGLGVAALIVTWVISRVGTWVLGRFLKRARMRRSLIDVCQMLLSVGIWILGILIATTIVFPSMTPGKIITAIGLGSIAIGFAFKDIFENFVAGVLILFREPFRIGDMVECGGHEGRVAEITIRDTHIRRVDGQRVVIPNATLFKEPVTVRTDLPVRRTDILVPIAFGENVARACQVLEQALRGLNTVQQDRDIQVWAHGFGAYYVEIQVTWWTGSAPVDIRRSRGEVVTAAKAALNAAGIEIPVPYRLLISKNDWSGGAAGEIAEERPARAEPQPRDARP